MSEVEASVRRRTYEHRLACSGPLSGRLFPPDTREQRPRRFALQTPMDGHPLPTIVELKA